MDNEMGIIKLTVKKVDEGNPTDYFFEVDEKKEPESYFTDL